MKMTIDDIAREAELLPEAERVRLVERLIAEFRRSRPALEQKWTVERAKLLAALERARIEAAPKDRPGMEKSLRERLAMDDGLDFEFEPPRIGKTYRDVEFD